MKKFVASLALGLMAAPVFAMQGPILTVRKGAGFTLPEYRVHGQCQIFQNKIEEVKGVGEIASSESRAINLKIGEVMKLIDKAAEGPFKTSVGPTDGPTLSYEAVRIMPNDSLKKVVLYRNGTSIVENQSSAARQLKTFIDLNCK